MKYSVGLQGPFDLALYFIFIGVGCIAVFGALLFLFSRLRKRDMKLKHLTKIYRSLILRKMKRKYLKQIYVIEDSFHDGNMEMRTAYQKMSMAVRSFVQEVTDIHVERLVITEIEMLEYEPLTELVREYYEPEFAFTSQANTEMAIQKSKELIKEWK